MDKLMSVAEVSEKANISRQRVLQVIEAGDLKAEKVGRNFVIRESDFKDWDSTRQKKSGRPRKQ